MGELRTDFEKLRTTIEGNSRTLLFQTIGVIAAAVAILGGFIAIFHIDIQTFPSIYSAFDGINSIAPKLPIIMPCPPQGALSTALCDGVFYRVLAEFIGFCALPGLKVKWGESCEMIRFVELTENVLSRTLGRRKS